MPHYDEQDPRSAYHAKQMLETNGHYAAERAGIAREATDRSRLEDISTRVDVINDNLCHSLAMLRGIHASLFGPAPEEVGKESLISAAPGSLGKINRSLDMVERNTSELYKYLRQLGEL